MKEQNRFNLLILHRNKDRAINHRGITLDPKRSPLVTDFLDSKNTRTNRHGLTRRLIALSLLLILFSCLAVKAFGSETNEADIQKDIASQIIRFHVIANSDSEEDQALKLKVKQAVTDSLRPKLEKAKNIEEARTCLLENLKEIETLSDKIIKQNGYGYTSAASLEHGYFPLKVYGDLSLPPGEYEAVRIELGAAKGQNWWCILFPPLCFVDATYSVVPDSSKEQLKYVLTDEEYNAVFDKGDVSIKVKCKLFSWIKDLIKE